MSARRKLRWRFKMEIGPLTCWPVYFFCTSVMEVWRLLLTLELGLIGSKKVKNWKSWLSPAVCLFQKFRICPLRYKYINIIIYNFQILICALEKKYLKLSDLWMMKMWWTIPSCLQKFAPWEKTSAFWLPHGLPGLSCPLGKSPWILRRSWPHKSEDDMHNVQYFAQFSFIKFFFFHFIFSMIYGKTSQPWAHYGNSGE